MAYNYQYSKAFSKNGAPVAPVKLTDLIGVSTPVTVSPTAPWGYRSYDKSLQALQKYTFSELWKEGIGGLGLLKPGGGIAGAGTTSDPLRVDTEWTDDRYVPSSNFPISQVGDPSDFILPISGSYFSVSYPYTNTNYPGVAYVEGNGDMRILHHVTNGEDLRPVYALWKDYKNNDITTMFKTDVVYEPPGLAEGEFIHNVFQPSENTMIAEVWRAEGFQEHVLIILSGTLSAKYHRMIRLGHQIFTELMGVNFSYGNWALTHVGIGSVEVGDKYYIGLALQVNAPQTNAVMSCVCGEVVVAPDGTATVHAMRNTTTTNIAGGVNTFAGAGFILHREAATYDDSNKDPLLYLSDPQVLLNSTGYPTGANPSNRMGMAGATPDGKIVIWTRNYYAVNTVRQTAAVKPNSYYILDPVARTIVPMPWQFGKRWIIGANVSGYITMQNRGIVYNDGHYWAGGSQFQILNDGNRVNFIAPAGSQDIIHALQCWWGTAHTPYEGADDNNFLTATRASLHLDPVPPTSTISGKLGYMFNSFLITSDTAAQLNQQNSYRSRNALIGSPTAKTYRLLRSGIGATPELYTGYALNNNRVGMEPGMTPYTFMINGTPYHHTGAWHYSLTAWEREGRYQLNDMLDSDKIYYLDEAIYTQLNSIVPNIKCPDPSFPDIHQHTWFMVGPYPKVGPQRAFFKSIISWKRDAPGTVLGVEYYGCAICMKMIDCEVTVDPDGTAHISSLNAADLPTDSDYSYYRPEFLIGTGSQRAHTGGLFVYEPDGSLRVNMIGGGGLATNLSSGLEGWRALTIEYNADKSIRRGRAAGSNSIYPATYHPTFGYGYITPNYGLGCFYGFLKLTDNLTQTDASTPVVIMGSARPEAGFNMTVSADIPVYIQGILRYIRPQIINLRDTKPDPRWSTFYMSAVVSSAADVSLVVSQSPAVDTDNIVYLGKIVTNETEISEMVLEPVTRWEAKRVSTEALGSAIIASTGHPGAPGEIAAISAGIDPTQWQGTVTFDHAASTVRVDRTGAFFVQDKDMAIARFGDFEQIEVTGNIDKGTVWLNGVSIWSGTGVDKRVINRNDLIKEGWNTISSQRGRFIMRGPFLKRNK